MGRERTLWVSAEVRLTDAHDTKTTGAERYSRHVLIEARL